MADLAAIAAGRPRAQKAATRIPAKPTRGQKAKPRRRQEWDVSSSDDDDDEVDDSFVDTPPPAPAPAPRPQVAPAVVPADDDAYIAFAQQQIPYATERSTKVRGSIRVDDLGAPVAQRTNDKKHYIVQYYDVPALPDVLRLRFSCWDDARTAYFRMSVRLVTHCVGTPVPKPVLIAADRSTGRDNMFTLWHPLGDCGTADTCVVHVGIHACEGGQKVSALKLAVVLRRRPAVGPSPDDAFEFASSDSDSETRVGDAPAPAPVPKYVPPRIPGRYANADVAGPSGIPLPIVPSRTFRRAMSSAFESRAAVLHRSPELLLDMMSLETDTRLPPPPSPPMSDNDDDGMIVERDVDTGLAKMSMIDRVRSVLRTTRQDPWIQQIDSASHRKGYYSSRKMAAYLRSILAERAEGMPPGLELMMSVLPQNKTVRSLASEGGLVGGSAHIYRQAGCPSRFNVVMTCKPNMSRMPPGYMYPEVLHARIRYLHMQHDAGLIESLETVTLAKTLSRDNTTVMYKTTAEWDFGNDDGVPAAWAVNAIAVDPFTGQDAGAPTFVVMFTDDA